MYTDVAGKYNGTAFGRLISDDGLSANLFYDGHHAYKVFNQGYSKSEAYAEAYAMARVEQLGIPTARVHQVLHAEGHWVLEMDFVQGPVMMDRVLEAAESGDMAALEAELTTLARLQARIHRADAAGLPGIKDTLRHILRQKEALTEPQREAVLAHLATLPEGTKVIHGDFQPFNVLYNGEQPLVIDWATAGAGVPACDVARTWLNFSLPPVPVLQRLELHHRYFRAYSRETGMELGDIEPWFSVMAALSVGRDGVFTAHMQQYL